MPFPSKEKLSCPLIPRPRNLFGTRGDTRWHDIAVRTARTGKTNLSGHEFENEAEDVAPDALRVHVRKPGPMRPAMGSAGI
jgi:hypothetical protein